MMPIEACKAEVAAKLSPARAQHSFNVAAAAVRLAEKYGADPAQAEIAGILHDYMKETPEKEQLQLLAQSGIIVQGTERCAPKLLHAMTGALAARTHFGVDDPAVLDAIRYHTTGRAGMTLLDKVLYIADFVSADRTYDGVDALRALADRNLDDAVFFGLAYTVGDLASHNRPIHEDTIRAYNELACACVRAEQEGNR